MRTQKVSKTKLKKPPPRKRRGRVGGMTVEITPGVVNEMLAHSERDWRDLAERAITALREVATALDGSARSSALSLTSRLERRRDELAGQLELFQTTD